mgnify:CR=1 FL=1
MTSLGAQPIPLDCPALEKDGQLPPNAKSCELPARIGELRGRNQLTFVCLSGMRSLRACAIAADAGLTSLGHLEGGLRAWQALPAPLHYSS